ncbi:MAG: DUF2383 domain-containing protein [Rhodanobacter sp.]
MPRHLQTSACHALVRRSIDLRQLYRHAAKACEPGLRMVLNDNVQTLDLLIAELQAQLRAEGIRSCGSGSWRGVVHRHLAGWLLHMASRRDGAWIRMLTHGESMLLHEFECAIASAPRATALALRRQLPRLHGIHMDMHSLAGTARY